MVIQKGLQGQLMTAAFFMEGLRDSDYGVILEILDCGCIELVADLVNYVPLITRLCDAAASVNGENFPGVFDYEVSSPFGLFFGQYVLEHSTTPPFEVAAAWLAAEVGRFFCQSAAPDEATAIQSALSNVVLSR